MRKLTTEEFIEKAKSVHRELYDYSKSIYVTTIQKVIIICKKHGEFEQKPNVHIQGSGCYKCGIDNRILTIEEFIEKAKKVHGELYDYSKSIYVTTIQKVIIICKKHGEFNQKPRNHIQGMGCNKCGKDKFVLKLTKTICEFIKQAKKVHGELYNYSKSIYVSSGIKLIIICKKHGEFEQRPNDHIQGSGCNICGTNSTANLARKSVCDFIKQAKKVHGELYDYSKSIYKNALFKLEITCKKHGSFWQTPINHLSKHGCSICKESKGERELRQILEKNKTKYVSQKRFETCKDNKSLPFDFYLYEYDICIEFNGKQHFEKVNFGGHLSEKQMQDNLQIVQKHDQIKRDYCKVNNIKLIEIPYWDMNIIEDILLREVV